MEAGGTVAVVGAGLMGHALALVHAAGGCRVRMQDIDPAQLERARGLIGAALDTLVGAGVHREDERAAILGRVSAAETIAGAVRGADLVVEAVVENRDVKRAVFAEIDAAAPPEALIASNTSHLDIFPLVPARRQPRALIAHWYTPPYVIDLVDLAPGPETERAAMEGMRDFYAAIGKKPVLFERFIPGYVANRLQAAMGLEITRLLDEGWADARAIDDSIKYGLALRMALMGALMKADFTGLDMMRRGMANRAYDPPVPKGESETLNRLIAEGRTGAMSGAGYFDYGGRTPEELFRDRDIGLLRLKAEAARIEAETPLGG